MMAEDVKSSEEESGLNILNFLLKDAISQRKEILESGRYIESEHIFSNGFYEVLPTSKQAALVLELLGTLSTITGKNASRESKGRYAKALTKYTTSSNAIKMWDSFIKKSNPDPRWTIYFLSEHGGDVVKAAMGDDRVAKGILESYQAESPSRWRRILEDRDEKDLDARTLLPKFATAMIEAAIVSFPLCNMISTNDQSHQNTPNTQILESTVHSIYTILTTPRHFRDYIPKNLTRKIQDFADFCNGKKKIARGIKDEQGWRGVRDMIDTLWDTGLGVEEYKLVWRESVPSSRTLEKGPLPPSRPVEKASVPPSRPGGTSNEQSRVTSRQPDPPQPSAGPSRPATSQPPSIPSRLPNPTPRVAEPIPRPATPPSPVVAKAEPASAPTQGLAIKSTAAPSLVNPSTPAPSAPDVSAPQTSTSTLNIRARATTSIPPKQDPVVPAPPAVPQGLSIRSASTPTPKAEAPPKGPSLLSRLAPSTSTPSLTPTTNKRARAEDFTPDTPSQEQPRRSLVDRLGGPGSDKKQRVSSNPEIGSAPSLLSRMSQQGQVSMPSSPRLPTPSNQFTIKRTTQAPPPAGISIKQPTPIASGLSIKRSGHLPAPAQSPGGLSIKNRSTSSTSTLTTQSPIQNQFKIKREVDIEPKVEVQPKAEVQVEDDAPVVRKGRGFATREFGNVELLITPPNPPMPFNGGRLQDRIGFQKR